MTAGFNTTEKLLTVKDVARILNVSQTTMRRIINSGTIGFFKFRGNIQREYTVKRFDSGYRDIRQVPKVEDPG